MEISRRALLHAPAVLAAPASAAGTYRLTREIPVEEGYDLVVAGGGPGGASAAICAARLGAKVLLVEATSCLGGMSTSGLVSGFAPVGDGERCLMGGFGRELIETLYKRGFLKPGIRPDAWQRERGWVPFNIEGLKLLYDELATAAGVEVRFGTQVIDADAGSGTVRGFILHNIEGYRYVRARCFIDGTGNAEAAVLCGAACREAGRDTRGIMPATLFNMFSGVDWTHVGDEQAALVRALKDNFFQVPDPHLSGMLQTGRQMANVNAGHVFNLNALRTKSLSDGLMYGRRLAQDIVAFYRKYVPGCENMEHALTAPLMGVRESRRIVGEFELRAVHFNARQHFPDQIGVSNYPVDVHPYTPDKDEYEKFLKEYGDEYKTGESFGLPYGILVPKGWKNLWVAGRTAASDIAMNGTIRVQPSCLMMGQAAGTAAVQSLRSGRSAAEIDTEALVNTLREKGAYLPQRSTAKRLTTV